MSTTPYRNLQILLRRVKTDHRNSPSIDFTALPVMADLPTKYEGGELNTEPLTLQDNQALTSHLPGPVHIAVIGGTGLQKLDGYEPVATVNPCTPWGYPSAPIAILKHSGVPIAFLSRHGASHELAPHEVPSRANIAALRSIGVRTIIAFSAVGSLQEEIKPRDFVVPIRLSIVRRVRGLRAYVGWEVG